MIWSIAVSVIFFAGLAVFLLRFVSEAGARFSENRILSFLTADKSPRSLGEKITAKECLYIFAAALIFRVIIFALGWIASGIFSDGSSVGFLEYCGKWNIWDGPHYIEIAQNGYAGYAEDGDHLFLVFFPLYPWIVRIFANIARNYVVSGIIVSMLCFSGGCALMYKLVAMDYKKSIARTSVVLAAVSPFAFFYGSVMTESLFFLVIIAVFLAIRKHNWLAAGALGILAALTRSVGVFMVFPAAIEWAQTEKPLSLIHERQWKDLGKRVVKLIPAALMPIGTLIYLYINYKVEGDPFAFMKYQSEHWSQNLQYFGKTVKMLAERGFGADEKWTFGASMFIPGLFSIVFAALVTLIGIRRQRLMYSAFMLIYFAFNAAASWPLSESRYLACMFPAYWIIASLTDKNKGAEQTVIALSAIAFGIYLAGYITVHSIM